MPITGSDFEELTQPFFRELFEKMEFNVIQVRRQDSGNQDGFDISVLFFDDQDKKRELFIECKYYTASRLNWSDIFNKQIQLHASNHNPSGFILLSPLRNLSNIDFDLQAKVKKEFKFPVDFWTPDKSIENLFALNKEIYLKIYNKNECEVQVDEKAEIKKYKLIILSLLNEKDNISISMSTNKNEYLTSEEFKNNIKEEIAKGDIDSVLIKLFEITTKENNNIVLMLRSQFSQLEKDKMLNLHSKEHYNLEYNRIVNGIINLLDRLD